MGLNVVPAGGRPNIRVEETVRLSLDHLAPHRNVTVAFDRRALDRYDLLQQSEGRHRRKLSGLPEPRQRTLDRSTLGYSNFFKESVYRLKVAFEPAADSLQLDFSSSLFEGKRTDDESWGLDNVRISVR